MSLAFGLVMRASLVLVAVLFFTSTAHAQFRTDVDLVTLDVCVRDASGRFVGNLVAGDFVVLENGVSQRVTLFQSADPLPLNVILLLDRSASMYGEKLDRAKTAVLEFTKWLRSEDRVEIIAFNQRATIVGAGAESNTEWLTDLTGLSALGATALYDAMVLAANQIARAHRADPAGRHTRDVIVILSDGEDTASMNAFDEVLPLLRRSGALVYGLSLRAGRDGQTLGATWPLQQLARDTGARAVGVPQIATLSRLYAEINQEVREMYRLGYVSTDARANGEWRQLVVRVTAADAQARTRAGYYAGQPAARVPR
jgi:VWFA-related protein